MRFDEFESVFRSAIKETYHYAPPRVKAVAIITDTDTVQAKAAVDGLRERHGGIGRLGEVEWHLVHRDSFVGIRELLEQLAELDVGLVVTWRNVFGRAADSPYALGSVLETLTQATRLPVLVMPSSGGRRELPPNMTAIARILVVTHRLTGDRDLLHWGLLLTPDDGTIYLAHVEDEAIFNRYLDAIGRVPSLDTELARSHLAAKLLQLPSDYFDTVVAEMAACDLRENLVPIVCMGNPLQEYAALVREHDIEMVIVNSHDSNQRAIDGTAHALALELGQTPVLML